jgi:hypothetical protein
MPIYSDGNIYGILIKYNDKKLFEKIYKNKINEDDIDEFELFYNNLTDIEKDIIDITFYTKCTASYNENNSFMCWIPGNRETLEKLLTILNYN